MSKLCRKQALLATTTANAPPVLTVTRLNFGKRPPLVPLTCSGNPRPLFKHLQVLLLLCALREAKAVTPKATSTCKVLPLR